MKSLFGVAAFMYAAKMMINWHSIKHELLAKELVLVIKIEYLQKR